MDRSDADDRERFEMLDAFLSQFDALIESEPSSALALVDAASESIRCEGQWVLCRAEALRFARGAEAAAQFLATVLEQDHPEFADAHHYLAETLSELGREAEAIHHYRATLRLDVMTDLVSEPASPELQAAMAAEAGRVLAELPPKFRDKVAHVPILLQPRPSEQLVAEGLDARALGLFEGPNLVDSLAGDAAAGPTAITLFTHCLLDAFGDDEEDLLQQVRVTVLHELGHYFCLDEEELAQLGLE